jgi:hypothetical protein
MGRAAGVVERSAARMERGFGGIKQVFAGSLLAGFAQEAAQAMVRLVPALVDGVAHLQDLEEKTGASAEALAAMVTPADIAGTSVDQLAGFMVKLTGTLSKTNSETKGAGAALKELGLDLATFRALAPEDQFLQLAKGLEAVESRGNNTALAIALLGKSGAEALPFFKELAAQGLSQNKVTAEQIRLADELADRNAKLRSELKQAAQVAAVQALPAFNALTEELTKAVQALAGIDGAATQLATNSGIRAFAEDAAEGLAVFADASIFAAKAFGVLSSAAKAAGALGKAAGIFLTNPQAEAEFVAKGTGPLREALDERERAVSEANARLKALLQGDDFAVSTGVRNRFAQQRIGEQAGLNDIEKFADNTRKGSRKPFVAADDNAANKALREAEQERKALLDKQLRTLEQALGAERDRLSFHADFIDRVYDNGSLSVAEFYEERRAIEARGLQQQLAAFKAEEEALRDFLAKTTDASDRVATETKIDDVRAKSAAALERYSQQAVLGYQAQAQATQQATDSVREFQAQLRELEGDAAGAAQLRAEAAIDRARRSARGIGLSPEDIASFERATQASVVLSNAQRNVQRITGELAREEERVAIAAQASGATRAQVEQQVFALRSRALAQMRQELEVAEQLANAADPNSPAVQFARELRLEFERLQLVVDPALERLRGVGDEVADALGQAAGAISLNFKDAKSAVDSLGQSLLRISTRELIEKPLADEFRKAIRGITEPGQGGGIGDFVRGIFKVGGAAPAAGAPGGFKLGDVFGSGALGQVAGIFSGGLLGSGGLLSPGGIFGSGTDFVTGFGGGTLSDSIRRGDFSGGGASAPSGDGGFSLDGAFGGSAPVVAAITSTSAAEVAAQAASETASTAALTAAFAGGAASNVAAITTASAAIVAAVTAGSSAIVAAVSAQAVASGAGSLTSAFGFTDLGFSGGGWTGNAPVDVPVGPVHGQEFVFSAPAVRRLGVGTLDRMHNEARRGARVLNLPGYADGGFVTASGGSARGMATPPRGGNTHMDFRGAVFGGTGADRSAAERQAVLNARAISREVARHSAG